MKLAPPSDYPIEEFRARIAGLLAEAIGGLESVVDGMKWVDRRVINARDILKSARELAAALEPDEMHTLLCELSRANVELTPKPGDDGADGMGWADRLVYAAKGAVWRAHEELREYRARMVSPAAGPASAREELLQRIGSMVGDAVRGTCTADDAARRIVLALSAF